MKAVSSSDDASMCINCSCTPRAAFVVSNAAVAHHTEVQEWNLAGYSGVGERDFPHQYYREVQRLDHSSIS